MQPVNSSNIQNQIIPSAQNKISEQNQKLVDTPPITGEEDQDIAPEDIVTISTQQTTVQTRSTSSLPSIPVSHAEMKALYKAFSVKI